MIEVQEPLSTLEWNEYYKIRWEILRKPLGLKEGSERDDLEDKAIHRIIKLDGQIVGVGRLHFNEERTAQIRYMAVVKNFRGKEFGKLIVSEFIKISEQNNISKIILYARESVVGFYEKLGFDIVEKAHRLEKVQHFLMERKK